MENMDENVQVTLSKKEYNYILDVLKGLMKIDKHIPKSMRTGNTEILHTVYNSWLKVSDNNANR